MIKRIRVANFKSIGDASLDLSSGVTVLIGRSGSGKTNFLEATRYLRNLLRAGLGIIRGNWGPIARANASKSEVVRFEVDFDFPALGGSISYQLSIPVENPSQVAEERLAVGPRVLFHQRGRNWVRPPEVPNGPGTGPILLPVISGIQEIAVACEVLSNGIGCYDFPGNVLHAHQDAPGSPLAPLADQAENFLAVLSAIQNDIRHPDHWKQVIAALQRLDPSIVTLGLARPSPSKVDVVHRVGRSSLSLDLSQESEGLRRFLAHLIALYQPVPRTLMAFDEPEKGIYAGALAVLAEEFKVSPSAGRGQIVLATHSPQLLDHFDPESVRVVEIEDGATKIGPLAPDQFESVKQQLLTPGELLTADPARITTPAA